MAGPGTRKRRGDDEEPKTFHLELCAKCINNKQTIFNWETLIFGLRIEKWIQSALHASGANPWRFSWNYNSFICQSQFANIQ